jgi:hypothetical protein
VYGQLDAGERQILVRIDGGIKISEEELRYQLDRKDQHPLARDERLIDVLADLEERGLITSMLCFRLTARGREGRARSPGARRAATSEEAAS